MQHILRPSRYILTVLLLFTIATLIMPSMAEPQRTAYLDLDALQLEPPKAKEVEYNPIKLSIKIEPPGTAGLVVDKNQSYIRLINAEAEPFPNLDRSNRYIDHTGEPVDLTQLKDYRPYMDNFSFTWQDRTDIKIKPNNDQPKLFFSSEYGSDTKADNDTRNPSWLLNINEDQFYEMNLVWFDAKEEQFYQSTLMINAFALFQRSQENISDQQFENILISLNRKGLYTIWLINDQLEIQITREMSAEKIQGPDWESFARSLPDPERNLSQKAYVTAMQNLTKLPYLDEMFHFKDQDGRGLPNIHYKVVRDDGRIYCGTSNFKGETKRINTGQHPHKLKLYYGKSCPNL